MSDWYTRVTEALQCKDAAAMDTERENWMVQARQDWTDATKENQAKPKPERRRKAKMWLRATDKAMRVCTHKFWGHYIVRAEADAHPERCPAGKGNKHNKSHVQI